MYSMNDVINEYQKWKQQGEDLRIQAKTAMETRFRELLSEAVHIAEMYRADFGAALKPPAAVTAFRFKASAKPKAKKVAGKGKPAAAAPRPPSRSRRPRSRIPRSPDCRSAWRRRARSSTTPRPPARRRACWKTRSTRSKTNFGWPRRRRQQLGTAGARCQQAILNPI